MAWSGGNISQFLTPVASGLNASKAALTSAMAAQSNILSGVDSAASLASSALSGASSALKDLNSAGMFTIALSAKQGGWRTRMSAALTSDGGKLPKFSYCTGMAMLSLFPGKEQALEALDGMLSALSAEFPTDLDGITDKAEDLLIDIEDDLEGLLSDLELAAGTLGTSLIDKLSGASADKWVGMSVGGLVPGALGEFAGTCKKGADLLKNLSGQKRRLLGKLRGGSTLFSKVENNLSKMGATGAYCITLEPGPGDFLARLSSESGAPPNDKRLYCVGVASVASAPNPAELMKKWDTISKFG